MANPDMTPDFIEIETDNFVSPNAATDVPADDFVALEIDPIEAYEAAVAAEHAILAMAPEVQASDVPAMVATETPTESNPLGLGETSVVHGSASGSLAEGTMRGVGFSTAEGYVTALANGVKAATAASYKQTLRQWMTQEQIDALPVTIIPEGDLPVSQNPEIVTHEGPNVFQARRLAMGLAPDARLPSRPRTQTPATQTPEVSDAVILPMVATAIETDERQCGIELAWNPASRDGHEIPRATVCALLDEHDLSAYHPPIPMPKGLFGVVFKQLNGEESREDRDDETRLLARCVTRNDYERLGEVWPDNLVSRYIVGTIDASLDLGTLGSKDLVCSLVKTETGFECQFSGGTTAMRQAITARFDALQGASMLNVTTLLKWYRDTMARKFRAIRDGFAMLIVDDGTEDAKQRIATAETLAMVLQGENEYEASPIMGRRLKVKRVISRGGVTQNQFYQSVGAALLDSVREHGKLFATEYATAQEHARKQESSRSDATPESIELAVRRAMIGSDRANSKAIGLLATLKALQARATAMLDAIGEHARPAINACEALRAQWAPKCKGIDATSEMFANIELD